MSTSEQQTKALAMIGKMPELKPAMDYIAALRAEKAEAVVIQDDINAVRISQGEARVLAQLIDYIDKCVELMDADTRTPDIRPPSNAWQE